MKKKSLKYTVCLLLVALGSCTLHLQAKELGFRRHFSDGMVLQREKPIRVSGFAVEGGQVTVSFAGQSKKATTNSSGEWEVVLSPLKANARGQKLNVSSSKDKKESVLTDVLVGDVVMVARQSSIDISLGRDGVGRKEASLHKNNPLFRAISIKTILSAKPLNDLAKGATKGWQIVTSEVALKMTGSSYYIGRDLSSANDVPVGIIDLHLGHSFPISWLSRETLNETENMYGRTDIPGQLKRFDKAVESYTTKGVVEFGSKSGFDYDFMDYALFTSGGYNGTIHPLKGLALKSVLLQLGNDYPYMIYDAIAKSENPFDRDELNKAYIQTYDIRKVGFRMERVTTPRIIREWRKVLDQKNLPFGLIVPPGSDLNTLGQHHREMREMQRLISEENHHAGVIMPGSEYIPFSAQPKDEVMLAERCLSWIEGEVDKKADVKATGPMFDKAQFNFNKATIYFKEGTASGLKATGEALNYFEAASIEGDYVPVKASIDGESIRLESDILSRITRVRYNWNSHPNQKLVNAAGLPAFPFRSEKADYHWFVTNDDDDLPVEYSTPANEWPKSDVTLVNGQLQTQGYGHFAGWIGPVGFLSGPFGPNMGVRKVKDGSPADGHLFEGDIIYSANGKMLGEKSWEVMAAAVTESETREARGKLVLGLRRGGRNRDVEITLDVKGTYSPTAPYDCPKTERLISDLEKWVVKNGAKAGFLNYDAVFMLGTGNPELQGYVRRIVYRILEGRDPNKPVDWSTAGKSWYNSAEAFLLGEYYLATGDRTVLPYLKHVCGRLTATQNPLGGWRQGFPGSPHYGLIPNAGLPGVMGMYFAKEAGLEIDLDSYERGVNHFAHNRAQTGFLIYGIGPLCERTNPPAFVPEVMNAGKMKSYNGGISCAGILMRFAGQPRAAHLDSLISSYAWNNTYGGHGGSFWGNFWTPLGAREQGREAFINFWKNHRWFRESNRMFDGSLIMNEKQAGAGTGVALLAPRERLQILGAPISPFSTRAPSSLKPAVAAYWKKDYAKCGEMTKELISSGTLGKDDLPTAEYLLRLVKEMQESIDFDLARMKKLCKEGSTAEAKSFVASLKGILPQGDTRLANIETLIASTKMTSNTSETSKKKKVKDAKSTRKWVRLISERIETDPRKRSKAPAVTTRPEEGNSWKIKILESMGNAPKGWTEAAFDDSGWGTTALPISWRMYHTALLRTTFNVEDKEAFDALRLYAWVFRQQGIEIYLNGKIIGKINNIERKTGDIAEEFKASALNNLKNGENTIAITTRHNWRWGMLFMKVYNDGFDFNFDARLKGAGE